jgi:hypothetical protein
MSPETFNSSSLIHPGRISIYPYDLNISLKNMQDRMLIRPYLVYCCHKI